MSESTQLAKRRPAAKQKPKKPHKDFPLFPHATRRWAKKVKGRMCYFGPWHDPDGALNEWLRVKDDLLAGRDPPPKSESVAVRDIVNAFLTSKQQQRDIGEIVNRTFLEYFATCEIVIKVFGRAKSVTSLTAADFERLKAEIAKTRGPVALGNSITRIRILFKYAHDAGLIDSPVRPGPTFRKPPERVIRKARNGSGPRMFEADEIRKLLVAASPAMRAMILLGINAGFGNADVGTLPRDALDLEGGWVSYPRPKTGIQRKAKLWPETVAALQVAIAKRPVAKDEQDANLVFLTRFRKRWHKDTNANPLSIIFRKLAEKVGVYSKGMAFYGLRHSFRTIADETRDFPAIDLVMGHSDSSMAARYRERIGDDRLEAIADRVHAWLWPTESADDGSGGE